MSLVAGIPDAGLNCYPTFADVDGDNLYDLLIGRDVHGLRYYKNTGTSGSPSWSQANTFSFAGNSTYWNNPTLVDFDKDDNPDMIMGTSDGFVFYYENTGSATSPSYQYRSDYFITIKNDGSGGTISFGDFDLDGDPDLISGNWLGKINYYENIGSYGAPVYQKKNNAVSNLSTESIYSTPAFVDFDLDGDLDVIAGCLNGKIFLYKNNDGVFANSSSVFAGIQASGGSYCDMADIDNDGDLDLVISGDAASDFRLYRNDGSDNFTEDNDIFSGLTLISRASVRFADVENDGDQDIIVGKLMGTFTMLENIGSPDSAVYQYNEDIFADIEVDQNACADFADIFGNGKPDMATAEYNGTFFCYKNLFANVTGVERENDFSPAGYYLSANYPNPFNPVTHIEYFIPEKSFVSLEVYNITGEKVATLINSEQPAGSYNVQFDGKNLGSGIYFYSLRAGDYTETKKMTLLK